MDYINSITFKDITKKCHQNISLLISFTLMIVLFGLYGLIYLIDKRLPPPLNIADEENQPQAFITERARQDLKLLTNIGPRDVNSYENDVAAEFLIGKINSILNEAHENQKLELDVQNVTRYFKRHYFASNESIHFQNVIVKLHANNNESKSLLINSHFDSVPEGPGASDDGINVAVMLEVLRKLSREPQRPKNNLVFLFNGAEEIGMVAAYSFITKHMWAKDCKVVLNLEACGSGGKIILFQTGPDSPWLMKYYRQVPHPYGQVTAEEFFQSYLLPFNTDFFIFVKYGDLIGLDMAFFKNGEKYHTKDDTFENIPPGSIQNAGDNVLSLVKNLGNAPEVILDTRENREKLVFFDFLGAFMVSYTETVACVINSVVVFSSFAIFIYSVHCFKLGFTTQFFKLLAQTFGIIIGGWIIAAIFVILEALLIYVTGYSTSWYKNPGIIFGLYVAPSIMVLAGLFLFVKNKNFSQNLKTHLYIHCHRIIWTLLLLVGIILNIRSMYIIMIPILFNVVGFILIYSCKIQYSVSKWLTVYFISLLIPTIFSMYVALLYMCFFIPVLGWSGKYQNIEYIMGLFSLLLTVLITSPFVPLAIFVKNLKYLLFFLGGFFLINFLLVFTS